MYLLLTLTQFCFLFNLRREHVPGPARCVGPVGERRSGQEHHHHRVGPGSQARWEEGEFKDQQLFYLENTEELFKRMFIVKMQHLHVMYYVVHMVMLLTYSSGWHPGR